jgi:hypothetical protein
MIYKVDVPDGVSGDWRVETFMVSERDSEIELARSMFSSSRGRGVTEPGVYKRLMRGSSTVMSNTPDEIRDQRSFVRHAQGNVLINGLGLGITLRLILEKEVRSVIVVEKSEDVIKLVAPTYLKDKRVQIVHADAFTYKPPKGMRFGAVWHDIWNDITSENLPQMHKLHRKYGQRAEWQGSWCRARCEYMTEQDKRYEGRWGRW